MAARSPFDRVARLPQNLRLVLAAVAGATGALGQAPYDLPLVLLLALALAFVLHEFQHERKGAALTGWAFGVGYFCITLVWIVEPFQIDPERHGWMAPFALVFMSAGLALFWGAAFWCARFLARGTWPLVLTWTAAELLRAYVFTGFPWASPAQALVDGLAGRSLAWWGPHGANLWLFASAWVLSLNAPSQHVARVRIAQAGLLLCIGTLLLRVPATPAAMTEYWVRLVQPNAEQQLKWQPEMARLFYDRQIALTTAVPEAGRAEPDLIVWPETAIPWTLENAGPALEEIARSASGTPVVLGVLRFEEDKLFNSLTVLGSAGQPAQIYDKHHLVPFGEYIPFAPLLTRLGLSGLATTLGIGFSAGPGPQALDFGPLGKALPLICYEAVFAHDVNGLADRPDFLLQITNDAWFGQNAGPQQHLAQARMRAIEQGLPLMRAANTGISAMIDPFGRITESLPLGTFGVVDATLPQALSPTLYSRTGDMPLALLLALGLLWVAVRRRPAPGRSQMPPNRD
jgi:apolipoprotein N-acyltransferase